MVPRVTPSDTSPIVVIPGAGGPRGVTPRVAGTGEVTLRVASAWGCHHPICRSTRQSPVTREAAGRFTGACPRPRQLPLPGWSWPYSNQPSLTAPILSCAWCSRYFTFSLDPEMGAGRGGHSEGWYWLFLLVLHVLYQSDQSGGRLVDDKKIRVNSSSGGSDDDDSWSRAAAPPTMTTGRTSSLNRSLLAWR